jgi:hypothetical protein
MMDDEKSKLFSKTKEILTSLSKKIKKRESSKETLPDELSLEGTSLYNKFLTKVIEIGITAAQRDYTDPLKIEGSIEGFNLCKGRWPEELQLILSNCRGKTKVAYVLNAEDYWKTRCCEAEVEWVCGCLSAFLRSEGISDPYVPTARQWITTLEIKQQILEEEK